MSLRPAAEWTRLIPTVLVAVSTLLIGARHDAVMRSPQAPLALASYALPDGSLPVLCGSGSHEPSAPDDGSHAACLATCVLAVPAGLLVASFSPGVPLAVRQRAGWPAAFGARPRFTWVTPQARAPPAGPSVA